MHVADPEMSAMRPAWPTSCWSTSVAPRMPECICVRFQMVDCVVLSFSMAVTAAPEIRSMTVIATSNSMSENPDSDFISLERTALQDSQVGRRACGAAEPARRRGPDRNAFQVGRQRRIRRAVVNLPRALVEPAAWRRGPGRRRARGPRRAAQVPVHVQIIDVQRDRTVDVVAAAGRKTRSPGGARREGPRVRDGV